MRYLVIGLGIYGANLARDLTALGHEVIGADVSSTNVEAIKDYISTAYILDTSEESALDVLPLRNVDLVVVAIGENFGASVKTVALLKQAGVKRIYARAIDPLHEAILQSFNVDRILKPEQQAASDLTREMSLGVDLVSMAVNDQNYVVKFTAPVALEGIPYEKLDLQREYGLKLVAATRATEKNNIVGIAHKAQEVLDTTAPGEAVAKGDVLTVFGSRKGFRALYKHVSQG